MNEVMQIVSERESVNKEIQDVDTLKDLKRLKRLCFIFI